MPTDHALRCRCVRDRRDASWARLPGYAVAPRRNTERTDTGTALRSALLPGTKCRHHRRLLGNAVGKGLHVRPNQFPGRTHPVDERRCLERGVPLGREPNVDLIVSPSHTSVLHRTVYQVSRLKSHRPPAESPEWSDMRDLHQMKELSEATGFGSFASDVVLAVDRLRTGTPREPDSELIGRAAELLATLPATEGPADQPRLAQGIAARDATRDAVALSLGTPPDNDYGPLFAELAEGARSLAAGRLDQVDEKTVDALLKLFGRVAEMQLARGSALLTTRSEPGPWMATQLV